MAKMSTSEVYSLLEPIHEFKMKLVNANKIIDQDLRQPDKNALLYHNTTFETYQKLSFMYLQDLMDIDNNAGWWNRRTGKSYMIDIMSLITDYQIKINHLNSISIHST